MGAMVRSSAAFQELQNKYGRASKAAHDMRKETSSPASVKNLMAGGSVLAGSALAGAARGIAGPVKGGVPTDVAVGLLAIGAAFGLGSPNMLFIGVGALSNFVSSATENAVKSRSSKEVKEEVKPAA